MPRTSHRRVQGTDVNGRTIELGAEIMPLAQTMYADIGPARPPGPRLTRPAAPGAPSPRCPRCAPASAPPNPGARAADCPNCRAEKA